VSRTAQTLEAKHTRLMNWVMFEWSASWLRLVTGPAYPMLQLSTGSPIVPQHITHLMLAPNSTHQELLRLGSVPMVTSSAIGSGRHRGALPAELTKAQEELWAAAMTNDPEGFGSLSKHDLLGGDWQVGLVAEVQATMRDLASYYAGSMHVRNADEALWWAEKIVPFCVSYAAVANMFTVDQQYREQPGPTHNRLLTYTANLTFNMPQDIREQLSR
jgi:hypothetical protein